MMKKYTLTLIAVFTAAALVLSACSLPGVNAGTPTGLANTSWSLVSYGPAASQTPAVANIETSLVFGSNGALSGNMGCNGFGGKYEVSDGSVTFSEVVSTLMACSNEQVMSQEQAAFRLLNGKVSYALTGSSLVLTDANGENALTLSSVSSK